VRSEDKKKEEKESHRERVDLDNFLKRKSSQGKSGKKNKKSQGTSKK